MNFYILYFKILSELKLTRDESFSDDESFFVKLLKSFDWSDLKIFNFDQSSTRLKMNELVIRPPVLRLSVLIIRTEIRTWPRSKEWLSGKMTELIKNVRSGSSIESRDFGASSVRGRPVIQGQRSYRVNSSQWIYFSRNNCLCHVVNCIIYRMGLSGTFFKSQTFLGNFDMYLKSGMFRYWLISNFSQKRQKFSDFFPIISKEEAKKWLRLRKILKMIL